MVIRDDVAVLVPHEAGARAGRDLSSGGGRRRKEGESVLLVAHVSFSSD